MRLAKLSEHQYKRSELTGLCGLLILFIAFFVIMKTEVLEFDAAMNFMVSKYLAINGDYATYYNEYLLFDPKIQTAGVVILLTTLLNLILGVKAVNMQIVTTLFLCLLMVCLFVYMRKKIDEKMALAILFFIAISPHTIHVSVSGYGEVTIACLMMVALLLYSFANEKRSGKIYFVVGLILGLGYLTKTIFLIVMPTFVFWGLVDIIKSKGKTFKYYLIIVCGFISPIILFETYRLYCLGIDSYVVWWEDQFDDILGQTGLTNKFTSGTEVALIDKVQTHYLKYSQDYNISPIFTIILYLVPGVYYIYEYKKNKLILKVEYMLYMISWTYFAWWCILSPTIKLFPRRILPGHIFILFLFGIFCARTIEYMIQQFKKNHVIIYGIMGYAFITVAASNISILETNINFYSSIAQSTKEMAEAVKQLPEDAKLYGCGWLQAPVVGVMADRVIYDIEKNELSDNDYFVYDIYTYWLSPDYLKYRFESEECYTLVFESGCQRIYKLNNVQ